MMKVLLEFEAWSVCETDDDTVEEDDEWVVYAEHYRDCIESNPCGVASWSWEFDDGINEEAGVEACWKCNTPVPPEVVALVRLHTLGRKDRYDN